MVESYFLNLLNKDNSFQVIKGLMPSILTIHIALKVLVTSVKMRPNSH